MILFLLPERDDPAPQQVKGSGTGLPDDSQDSMLRAIGSSLVFCSSAGNRICLQISLPFTLTSVRVGGSALMSGSGIGISTSLESRLTTGWPT